MKNYQTPLSTDNLLKNNTLVKHYAGSLAYGTNLPTSDVDIRGIFCADPINILTPFFNVRECAVEDEEDTKYYELSHFMKLCLECNPNIIETLWIDESDILERTPEYDLLREHRSKLLSSKVAFTFSGYAISQLKRIKGHNKWINNPQGKMPPTQPSYVSLVHNFTKRKMFKIDLREFQTGYRLVPYDGNLYGVYASENHSTFSSDMTLNIEYDPEENFFTRKTIFGIQRRTPLFIVKFNKEQYKQDKEKWKQYWYWKRNRNKIRSALEEEHGMDTKHSMHLVRLLRMGKEILETGKVIVKRPDAQELLDIRNGSLTYEELIEYAESMDDLIRNKLYKTTDLPKKPDIKFAANLLMETQNMVWEKE